MVPGKYRVPVSVLVVYKVQMIPPTVDGSPAAALAETCSLRSVAQQAFSR
jgi:hypothetical protein